MSNNEKFIQEILKPNNHSNTAYKLKGNPALINVTHNPNIEITGVKKTPHEKNGADLHAKTSVTEPTQNAHILNVA